MYMSSHPDQTLFCAPGVKGRKGSCFNRQDLIRIIDKYNKHYPSNRIIYDPRQTPDDVLWENIRQKLADRCKDQEWCWLDQEFLSNDAHIQDRYKPPKPIRPRKWLSTRDIDNVLKQFENTHKYFKFMGTVPIDFDEVIDEYKNINICKLHQEQGITQYGFVFNLDPHDRRGSHWVSMFMDVGCEYPFIGFFDSYASPTPRPIRELIKKLQQQVETCMSPITLTYMSNTVQHQHENTECGVYSLYFIFQCLNGYSFKQITENIILDDEINTWRHFFFRHTIHYRE